MPTYRDKVGRVFRFFDICSKHQLQELHKFGWTWTVIPGWVMTFSRGPISMVLKAAIDRFQTRATLWSRFRIHEQ